jgi:acyl-CoA synthetase (NDP forming)
MSTAKPVLAFGRIAQNSTEISRKFQKESGAPFIQGLSETVRALQNLVRYADATRDSVATLPSPSERAMELDDHALGATLTAYGLPEPPSALAKTPDDAASQAVTIGFPVAVKIISPEATHKTEVGGVALGLRNADEVREAAARMAALLAARHPQAPIEGFLVQPMVDGLEMIVGVREDPQFGPFMLAGLGGIQVEVMRDVAIRLLPVDEKTARDMIGSLRAADRRATPTQSCAR